jgi:hypothetical protein
MTIDRLTKADLPQSMGAFKPVGHVLLAFPDDGRARGAAQALHEAGFADDDILDFTCRDLCSRMEQMLQHASEFSGFGYEVVLMKRYKALCDENLCSWVLVYAPDDGQTQPVAEAARRHGALTAVKYHRLAEEDLI